MCTPNSESKFQSQQFAVTLQSTVVGTVKLAKPLPPPPFLLQSSKLTAPVKPVPCKINVSMEIGDTKE